ncbi:MAG: hypothetical protein Q8M03_16710 [Legionella sp.]|nr:hypothetical protein [Legionella sp.]
MVTQNISTHEEHCHLHGFKRISWTAIFIGALTAVGLGFLLNLFGVAIGLSAINMNSDGGTALAWGGLIGILIGIIVSMVVAGYVAGYLGRLYCPQRNLGILYGFITWTVALILSAVVTASLSQYISSYSNNVATSVVVSQNNTNTVVVETPAADNDATTDAKPAAKVATTPGHLAAGVFMIFALFFIGAISACVGACWGMTCRRAD